MSVRQTSIAVYHQIIDGALISERKRQIYAILFQFGPLTGNEIFRYLDLKLKINQANIYARLGEMVKVGVVKECDERQCNVTGNNVLTWDVTDELPKPIKKTKTDKQKLLEYRKLVNQIQARLEMIGKTDAATWVEKRVHQIEGD